MQLGKLVSYPESELEYATLTPRSTPAILYKLKLNQSVTTIPTGVSEPSLIWPDADTSFVLQWASMSRRLRIKM